MPGKAPALANVPSRRQRVRSPGEVHRAEKRRCASGSRPGELVVSGARVKGAVGFTWPVAMAH